VHENLYDKIQRKAEYKENMMNASWKQNKMDHYIKIAPCGICGERVSR